MTDNADETPANVAAGQHRILNHEVDIEWLNPPIPNASGWYWSCDSLSACIDTGGPLLQGPFLTTEAAWEDARDMAYDKREEG